MVVRTKVLLVIPAYNEAKRISAPLKAYLDYARGRPDLECRFLVVLNGCRDGTAALAARLFGEFPELSSLEYKEPIGKGGALLAGFRQARDAEWVGFTDADGATPPDSLFGLLADPVADVMVGKRNMSTRPFGRRLASFCFNSLVRLLLGLRTQDVQCGAKFFPGRVSSEDTSSGRHLRHGSRRRSTLGGPRYRCGHARAFKR